MKKKLSNLEFKAMGAEEQEKINGGIARIDEEIDGGGSFSASASASASLSWGFRESDIELEVEGEVEF